MNTICDHHEKELLTCYLITKKKSIASQLKKCSNPFNVKHKAGKRELRGITETLLQKYPVLMGLVEIGERFVHHAESRQGTVSVPMRNQLQLARRRAQMWIHFHQLADVDHSLKVQAPDRKQHPVQAQRAPAPSEQSHWNS